MTDHAPNFGHHHAHSFGAHIDGWGDGPLLIRWGKRKWWFEFADMWGPTLLRPSDFEPCDGQPVDEADPFWEPFTRWHAAGKKCRAIRHKGRRGTRVLYWICHVPKGARHD